jgi:SAM-dependent methyltransferase
MNRQEFYRQEYKRINPDWEDSVSIYRNYIDKNTDISTRILDFGCGHVDFMKSVYSRTVYVYGIEPNIHTLHKNITIKNKVVGVAEYIPFPDDFFDFAVSAWVVEHIENTTKVFSDINRVLKPGGKLVFLTPNSWNYITWINRSVPNSMHEFLTRSLYGREERDTYSVRYKMNSIAKMDFILSNLGFKKDQVMFNGDPSYISFNRPLFMLSCFIEKLLDLKYLDFTKVHVIGVYQKQRSL